MIRLMFRFDVNAVVEKIEGEINEVQYRICKIIVDDCLNSPNVKPTFSELYLDSYTNRWPDEKDFIIKLIQVLETWEFNIAMFVLGFVVFKICEKIKLLHKKTKKKPEDELWITSFWNLRINRISKT